MSQKVKPVRYYYWILRALIKKHIRLILLSFFLTFFIVVSLILFTPYLASLITIKKDVIGITGAYTENNLPEEVISKVSHGLVVLNQKGEIIPALASSWEARDNNREFRFHIKKGLFWGDGKEFKAKDISYKFKDVDVQIIDNSTIYFKLKKPLAIFPTYLTAPIIKNPLDGVAGAYKVDRIKSKYRIVEEITLSPNKVDMPALTYRFYDSESKMITAYKKGEINQMSVSKKSVADSFMNWKNTEVSKDVDYTRVLTLFFNLKNPTLAVKDVRQAIAESILKDKFDNDGKLAQGPIPPVSWAYNPDVKTLLYDPEIAKKNVKKNVDSTAKTLEFKTYYDYLAPATAINDYLHDIGLKTNLSLISFESDTKFDLLLSFWKIPLDPDQYYIWHSTQIQSNITGYKNVKVDKLLEDGRSTLSFKDRKDKYFQFQKVFGDDVPAVFMYYPYVYTIKRK